MIKIVLILSFLVTPAFGNGTFAKHEANLLQFQGKISTDEKAIMDLIKEKNETKDLAKQHEAIAEIKKLMKSRRENIDRYNKEYYHLEYEHPGNMNSPTPPAKKEEVKKGGHSEEKKEGAPEVLKTRYKRYDEKTIKEFEDEMNKILSGVYGNVKKKYNSKEN